MSLALAMSLLCVALDPQRSRGWPTWRDFRPGVGFVLASSLSTGKVLCKDKTVAPQIFSSIDTGYCGTILGYLRMFATKKSYPYGPLSHSLKVGAAPPHTLRAHIC
jgi:hypothetical protein